MLQTISLIILCFLLSSCSGPWDNRNPATRSPTNNATQPQRTANQNYMKDKRWPVYNPKYITQAQRNIANDDYELSDLEPDIDPDEIDTPDRAQLLRYKQMMEFAAMQKKLERRKKQGITAREVILTKNTTTAPESSGDVQTSRQTQATTAGQVNNASTEREKMLISQLAEMQSTIKNMQLQLNNRTCSIPSTKPPSVSTRDSSGNVANNTTNTSNINYSVIAPIDTEKMCTLPTEISIESISSSAKVCAPH